ncbi:MAG: KamA family radical SAM protein [Spirochaetales bacterium]|nr:KamA family radical SAM protein [Spirochaetales bacterium]
MGWKNDLRNCIEDVSELAGLPIASEPEFCGLRAVTERFPMRIPQYYRNLINWSDPDDPIRRMCVPSMDELESSGSFDTSGEERNTKQTGLQHKYTQTALILSTNICAMYCRHCFRKRMVGLSEAELSRQLDEAVDYVRSHPEITNVLISGGDSLMMPDSLIRRYLEAFTEIESLHLIRFGSRIPVVLPQRIDDGLISVFREFSDRKQIYLVTQFNHPRELSEESVASVRRFIDVGVQVRNQTVLLRGVNDSPAVMGELLQGLTATGIVPYYIFQCRPVRGVRERFQIPLEKGIRVVDGAKEMQSGIGKSVRYVMSHPKGKIEMIGMIESGETVFKFHQSADESDSARIFTRVLDADSRWLDDNLDPY